MYTKETDQPRYGWHTAGHVRWNGKIIYVVSEHGTVAAVSYQADSRDGCADGDPATCQFCSPGWVVTTFAVADYQAACDAVNNNADHDGGPILDLVINGVSEGGLYRTAREAKVAGEKVLGVTGHKSAPKPVRKARSAYNDDGYVPLADGRFAAVMEITDDEQHQDHDVCYYIWIYTRSWMAKADGYQMNEPDHWEYQHVESTDGHYLVEQNAIDAMLELSRRPVRWQELDGEQVLPLPDGLYGIVSMADDDSGDYYALIVDRVYETDGTYGVWAFHSVNGRLADEQCHETEDAARDALVRQFYPKEA